MVAKTCDVVKATRRESDSCSPVLNNIDDAALKPSQQLLQHDGGLHRIFTEMEKGEPDLEMLHRKKRKAAISRASLHLVKKPLETKRSAEIKFRGSWLRLEKRNVILCE